MSARETRVTLENLPALLSVTSEPTGALVWLNGVGPKETPNTFSDLAPGPYTLRLQKYGFNPRFHEVVLGPGDNLKVGPLILSPNLLRPIVPSVSTWLQPAPVPKESIPPKAEFAGTIKLTGRTRLEYILNVIRSTALTRGWNVVKSDNNVVVLNLLHQGFSTNLYLRCEPKGVEIYSDPSKGGVFDLLNQIPASFQRDLKADLTRQLY